MGKKHSSCWSTTQGDAAATPPSLCWMLSPLASRNGNKKLQWLTPGSDSGRGVALEGWKHLSAVVEKPKNPPPHTNLHQRAQCPRDRAASASLGLPDVAAEGLR